MTDWPAHVEPLDRAILDMLCEVPGSWMDWDHDRVTSTQEEALRLLGSAGLIEQRVRFEVQNSMLSQKADVLIRVSGLLKRDTLMAGLLKWLPDWIDQDGKLRGQTRLVVIGIEQIRLTDQGELARHDYQNQTMDNPSSVVAFVRKIGFFANRQDVKAKVVIEQCDVFANDTNQTQSKAQNLAAAQANAQSIANASVGDINVHHHTHINNDFGELAALLRQILDRPVSSTKISTPSVESPAPLKKKAKPQQPRGRGMSVEDADIKAETILAEQGWPGNLRLLAKLVGCSHETLRKCDSVKPYLKRPARREFSGGTDYVGNIASDDLDPSEVLAYEEEFQMIYDKADPKEQRKLDRLTPEQKRRMIDTYRVEYQDRREDDRPQYASRRRKL